MQQRALRVTGARAHPAAMKVLLAPIGSRGDVAPMVALGRGLVARGHDVTLLVPADLTDFVSTQGLMTIASASNVTAILQRHSGQLDDPVAVLRILVRECRRELQAQIDELERLVPAYDLVVGAGLQLAAVSVCRGLGVPVRTVIYTTSVLPSAEQPPFWLPFRTTPRWLNPWLWALPDWINGHIAFGPLQVWRRAHGLAAEWMPIPAMIGEQPILACDRRIATPPGDAWPAVEQTGWLRLADEPELDPDLVTWLDAGTPPIYLGFGSMVDGDTAGTLATARALAEATGRRVLVVRGWSNHAADAGSDAVRVIDGAPHGRLFPRCACVIHHGGAGTTQAAANAGLPQVIVPHLLDQFDFADRIVRAGLGPPTPSRRHWSASALIRCAQSALTDDAMRERAAQLGVAMRAEDGVSQTIDALERTLVEAREGRTKLGPPRPKLPWMRWSFWLGAFVTTAALVALAVLMR